MGYTRGTAATTRRTKSQAFTGCFLNSIGSPTMMFFRNMKPDRMFQRNMKPDSNHDIDTSLHHDSLGLELEAILPSSPRQPYLTNSGSLLYLRSRPSPPPSLFVFTDEIRTPTMAQSAYYRITGRRGVVRSNSRWNVLVDRSRITCYLASLLGMVILTLSLNLFEGSYVQSIFNMSVTDKAPNTPHKNDGRSIPTSAPSGKRPAVAAIVVPKPYLSVHEHKIASFNSSFSFSNTFTTWLDFDEHDPPPRKHYPVVGDGEAFAAQWCDLTGTRWYPTNESRIKDVSWQQRAPAFLLPGAAYSGTVFLATLLHQHPSILPARSVELQFFHERPFRRYVSASEKTLVRAARERMYARDYSSSILKRNGAVVSFDATPGYLFYSSLLPRRILCVEPWVQLVLVLRNPVDRVLEQYAALQQRGLKQSLEQWIDQEFAIMERVGLIPGPNHTEDPQFSDSKEEDVAWYDYQTASVGGGIGRSLYVIQIRQWIAAFRTAGRNPAEAILIVRTDHVAANPATEYERTLNFLKLPAHPLPQQVPVPIAVTHQTRSVSEETRQRLEYFFQPYNRRLKRLMRQHGISSSAEEDVDHSHPSDPSRPLRNTMTLVGTFLSAVRSLWRQYGFSSVAVADAV